MLPYSPQMLCPTPAELLSSTSTAYAIPYIHDDPPPPPNPKRDPPDTTVITKTETQRKARQRAVAEEIGFIPTDPDTISSHEKKRHYLECLEHYVLYLHEQLRLVQTPPLTLERVSTYRGLSSRSIRTLLVHMQNVNKNLHQTILAEEQVFLGLSGEVGDVLNPGVPQRRHAADVVTASDYTVVPDSVFVGSEGYNEAPFSIDDWPSTRGSSGDPHAALMLNMGMAAGHFGRV
ncbi:hypothetical protein V8B97DRAFT_2071769 [Scleroderma yunnanense]